jgi:hypothetical protein
MEIIRARLKAAEALAKELRDDEARLRWDIYIYGYLDLSS